MNVKGRAPDCEKESTRDRATNIERVKERDIWIGMERKRT